jgi:hypothetical protein
VRESGLLLPGEYPRPWPAIVAGRWHLPGPAHVLDHFVRDALSVDDNAVFVEPETVGTSQPGTVGVVGRLPECDICEMQARAAAPARFDGPAGRRPSAGWAFMCFDCFLLLSRHELGLGIGQYLLTFAEVPAEVPIAYRRAMRYWRRRGVDVPQHDPFAG